MRDLKAVGYDLRLFWRFNQTVKNYLAKVKKEYEDFHKRPHHVIVAAKHDTIGTVIARLAEHNIHRIFITELKRPIGIVSLKDILLEILHIDS